jgi:AraC-like DNA-binding protein
MNTRSGSDPYKDQAVEVLRAMAGLLDDLPHVMFCAKDRTGTYLVVNQAFADRAGVREPSRVVGRSACDLFDEELATSYTRQDDELWSSRQPLRNQLELITRTDGSLGWYVTTKVLVAEGDGREFLASLSVDLRAAGDGPTAHAGVAAAVDYARAHCTEHVPVGDVAAAAEMSVVQLERTTRRIIGISVRQLLVRFRVERAIALLDSTDSTLSDIAARCGYYDQSAFTRQFRRVVGVSPGAYRSRGRDGNVI